MNALFKAHQRTNSSILHNLSVFLISSTHFFTLLIIGVANNTSAAPIHRGPPSADFVFSHQHANRSYNTPITDHPTAPGNPSVFLTVIGIVMGLTYTTLQAWAELSV
ncbi:hypothetical protein GGS21DRAFT_519842, partial [Xylaria nigripes]